MSDKAPTNKICRIVHIFFFAFYVASGGFELRLLFFPRFFVYKFLIHVFAILYIFWFAQYCLSKIPLLYIRRAIKRPRTRSAAARQVSNAHERDVVV